jgi:hypothetical protein
MTYNKTHVLDDPIEACVDNLEEIKHIWRMIPEDDTSNLKKARINARLATIQMILGQCRYLTEEAFPTQQDRPF